MIIYYFTCYLTNFCLLLLFKLKFEFMYLYLFIEKIKIKIKTFPWGIRPTPFPPDPTRESGFSVSFYFLFWASVWDVGALSLSNLNSKLHQLTSPLHLRSGEPSVLLFISFSQIYCLICKYFQSSFLTLSLSLYLNFYNGSPFFIIFNASSSQLLWKLVLLFEQLSSLML